MNKKTKLARSISAFAFALTLFASNAQVTGAVAYAIDDINALAYGTAVSGETDHKDENGGENQTSGTDNDSDADKIADTHTVPHGNRGHAGRADMHPHRDNDALRHRHNQRYRARGILYVRDPYPAARGKRL